MNKSYSVGDLMSIYYENEFLAVEDVVLPKFSAKHNRKMKTTFDIFAKRQTSVYNQPVLMKSKRPLSIRKQFLIAAIIIVSLAFITGCVIAFISNSFRGTVYNDNTYLFAFDIGDSPTVIEEEYTLSVVPEGYELHDIVKSSSNILSVYKNSSNQNIFFTQTAKREFNSHINTEGFIIDEFLVDDCDAIYVEYKRETGINSMVIWNNEEYILELYGNFTKEELIDLAICNEIESF